MNESALFAITRLSMKSFSFPLIPQCAGIHWSTALFTVVLRDWREAVRVFVSLFREFCNAWSTERASVKITTSPVVVAGLMGHY